MKVIFYKSILKEETITYTDKIVFCQMLYMSLMENQGVAFNSDGEFTLESINEDYDGFVPIPWRVNESIIMDILNINRRQYYLSCQHLKKAGYLIKVNKEKRLKLIRLIPFFKLKVDTGLRGLELILFSFLSDKVDEYGFVNKYHDALANDLFLLDEFKDSDIQKKKAYTKLESALHELYKNNYLEKKRIGNRIEIRIKR